MQVTFRALSMLLLSCMSLSCKWRSNASKVQSDSSDKLVTTIYSKEAVPASCIDAYRSGVDTAMELLKKEGGKLEELDTQLNKQSSEECRYFFSLGAFDSIQLAQQTVVLEYMLELKVMRDSPNFEQKSAASSAYMNALRRHFQERLHLLFADDVDLTTLDDPRFRPAADDFAKKLSAIAREQQKIVNFGRFIVTQEPSLPVFTAFEFELNEQGRIEKKADGQVGVRQGTYFKALQSIGSQMEQTVQNYLKWKPGLFYGNDSAWTGVFWRTLGVDKSPSLREVKQDGFDQDMRTYMNAARLLQADMKPFEELYKIMLKRERELLEREAETYRRTTYGLYAAPLIPIGMAIGAAGLASVGFKALVGASSFTYAGASLASAANASALLSLTAIVGLSGYSGYQSIRAARQNGDAISTVEVFDSIVAGGVLSFPMAAALPAVVGQTAAGVKSLVLSVKSLIVSGGQLSVALKTMTWGQIGRELPQLPLRFGRWWVTAWWQKKVMIVQSLSDSLLAVGMEIGTRQMMGGDSAFFLRGKDGKTYINSQAKVTLANSILIPTLGRPLMTIENFAGRYLAMRSFGMCMSMASQLAFNGKVDPRRIAFDEVWQATFGIAQSEATRSMFFSGWMDKRSPASQFMLNTLWKISIRTPYSALRNHLLDRYVKNRKEPLDDLVKMVREQTAVELRPGADAGFKSLVEQGVLPMPIDDDEIRDSLDRFLNDEDVRTELGLKKNP